MGGPDLLSHWLLAFILGSASASVTYRSSEMDHGLVFVMLCIGLFVCLVPKWGFKRRVIWILLAGFAWGWLHNAPPGVPGDYIRPWRSNLVASGPKAPLIGISAGGLTRVDGESQSSSSQFGLSPAYKHQSIFAIPLKMKRSSPKESPASASRDLIQWPRQHLARCSLMFLGYGKLDPSDQVVQAMKVTGTYHLLVVSGLHVSLIAGGMAFIVGIPWRLMYGLRLLRHDKFLGAKFLSGVLGGLSAGFVVWTSGMGPPAQRSILGYFVSLVARSSSVRFRSFEILLFTATLQTLIFPIGFLSPSTAVSWGAYLLVLPSNFENNAKLSHRILIQIKLFFVTTGIFGYFAPIGVLINFWAIPLFTPILATAPMPFIFGDSVPLSIVKLVILLHRLYFDWIQLVAGQILRLPYSYADLSGVDQESLIGRSICLVIGAAAISKHLSALGRANNTVKRRSWGSPCAAVGNQG